MARIDVGNEISRQVGIESGHPFVDGSGAEADEAVGPHEDGAAIGHTGFGCIEACVRSIDDRHELAPPRADTVEVARLAEHDQMVARAAQTVAGR